MMDAFHEYLEKLEHPEHRTRVEEVLTWVGTTFPELKPIIAWNEPMFSHHDTFIIGFSVAKHHMAVSPEVAGITKFEEEIKANGYTHTKGIFRIKWSDDVNYELLRKMIAFNIEDKAETKKFWR